MGILINLKKCHLQLNNLDKLFFVNKDWPNDHRIGCKPFSNLVKLIEIDEELEENLKRTFERDENLEM